MKFLFVGLGNIGTEYDQTRHNIGFMAMDALAKKYNAEFELKRLAYHASFRLKGKEIHLIKPTTYMNLSGKAIQYWLNQEKIPTEHLVVITDDLALP
ncbi:MAG: aminoacyl-tRNA hydrolase, partial [Spirosomataceae bacterium]